LLTKRIGRVIFARAFIYAAMIKPPDAAHTTESTNGWRLGPNQPSLPEVHRSIVVPKGLSFWRKMLAFSGPGYLVAVVT